MIFNHLEDTVFAPDSCCLWCADLACDGNNCSSTFDPDDFYEAITFFMQQLQPLVANAKLDGPLDSHPPLSRELMLTRLEADDWGDTADGTHYGQEEHEYTEHYAESYEQQEHQEHIAEQHRQGIDFDEHGYHEESNGPEHTQEQAPVESEDEYQDE
jgi:hypothetical protein